MNIQQYKDKVITAGFDEETTRVLLGLEFQVHGDQAYVDSLQIAELLEVNHRDLLVTVRNFIKDEVEVELEGNFEGMRKFPQTPHQPIQGIIETTFQHIQNKQNYPMYLINEENTLIIIMKSNSKNATKIRRIIAKGFLLLRDILTTPVLSPLELMVKQAQALLDHDLAIKAQQKQLEATNSKVDVIFDKVAELSGERGYMTIMGYANKVKRSVDKGTASKLGKACSNVCRKKGLEIKKINDERYGEVGNYPLEVVREVFDAYYLIN